MAGNEIEEWVPRTEEGGDEIPNYGRRRASIGASAFALPGGHLEFGKNYLQWHGTRAELVVTEAELCNEILNNKDGFYPKPKFRAYAKKIFGKGLPQLEGENWAKS